MSLSALDIAIEIQKILVTHALKQQSPELIAQERKLTRAVRSLFDDVMDKTIDELEGLGHIPASMIDQQMLVRHILDAKEDLADVITDGTQDAARVGRYAAALMIPGGVHFDDFSRQTHRALRDSAFEASDRIISRMTGDVMGRLAEGYAKGLGIRDVASSLTDQFSQIRGYETRRIARTEINSAQSAGRYLTMQEEGIEYHQWWTAEDDRVREEDADHVILHGQIVRIGDPFSNGLRYPGDKSGDISEWINCRCIDVPFLMPLDMMPPLGMSYFYEHDIIDQPLMG